MICRGQNMVRTHAKNAIPPQTGLWSGPSRLGSRCCPPRLAPQSPTEPLHNHSRAFSGLLGFGPEAAAVLSCSGLRTIGPFAEAPFLTHRKGRPPSTARPFIVDTLSTGFKQGAKNNRRSVAVVLLLPGAEHGGRFQEAVGSCHGEASRLNRLVSGRERLFEINSLRIRL